MDFGVEGQRLVFNLSKVAMYEVEVIQTDYVETIKFPGSINTFISWILFKKEQRAIAKFNP